jgi:hypothetical protein
LNNGRERKKLKLPGTRFVGEVRCGGRDVEMCWPGNNEDEEEWDQVTDRFQYGRKFGERKKLKLQGTRFVGKVRYGGRDVLAGQQ